MWSHLEAPQSFIWLVLDKLSTEVAKARQKRNKWPLWRFNIIYRKTYRKGLDISTEYPIFVS